MDLIHPHVKTIHRAKLIAPDGSVSPLCAKKPRAIDLKVSSWTLVDGMVTCPHCRKANAVKAA